MAREFIFTFTGRENLNQQCWSWKIPDKLFLTYFYQEYVGSHLLKFVQALGSILPSFLYPSAGILHALATLLGACYLPEKNFCWDFQLYCNDTVQNKTGQIRLHPYMCLKKSVISYWLTETYTAFSKIMLKHDLFWFCTDQPFKLAEPALNQSINVLAGIYTDSEKWLLR